MMVQDNMLAVYCIVETLTIYTTHSATQQTNVLLFLCFLVLLFCVSAIHRITVIVDAVVVCSCMFTTLNTRIFTRIHASITNRIVISLVIHCILNVEVVAVLFVTFCKYLLPSCCSCFVSVASRRIETAATTNHHIHHQH